MAMQGAFLETSALANLFYKAEKERKTIQEIIPEGTPLITSEYVIYELSRGFIRNLILIHNKAILFKNFSDLFRYGNAMRRKSYFLGAMLEAFTKYFSEAKIEAPSHIKPDEYQLITFRSFLRRDIRRGWLKQQRSISKIVNNVGCRDNIPAPSIGDDGQYHQELKKHLCGHARSCGLKHYTSTHRQDFETLRDLLKNQSNLDDETTKRIKSLRELYRVPNTDFHKNDCYSCGDAIICHEAPKEFAIITLNQKHYVPMCNIFGKCLSPLKSHD
jgi:hypothetical protein